jgi:sugar phosphate isomerase/epimerase
MAAEFGYDGLEWRGGPQGHVQPSMSASSQSALCALVSDAGLRSVAVTAYTSFTSLDARTLKENLDELRRYADLAVALGARYVRAFLGELYPGADLEKIHDNAARCLLAAAEHARSVGVGLAVEPHDDFVRSASAVPILEMAQHPAIGAVWDIGNTCSAGEAVEDSYRLLGSRIVHVHVKDGVGRLDDWRLTRLGEGEVPLKRAFELLLEGGYTGALSLEWERAWHPELDPPEVALPHSLRVMRNLLARSGD